MKNTKIEWADHTANFWSGCSKVSPGCLNCYAASLANRAPKTFGAWGRGAPRKRHLSADKMVRALNAAQEKLGAPGPRPRVFVNSLADWLDHEVPVAWRVDLLNAIAAAPNLDFLLLTKRPESWAARMYECMSQSALALEWVQGTPPHNVWVGTSCENQEWADRRIPALLEIPARVRFLSMEPLLGPVMSFCHNGIQWVIVGGESGPGARPCHVDWVRDIVYHCQAAETACFVKQLGAKCVTQHPMQPGCLLHVPFADRKGGDMEEWPADLRVREFPAVQQ